jgi:hypothetical protein
LDKYCERIEELLKDHNCIYKLSHGEYKYDKDRGAFIIGNRVITKFDENEELFDRQVKQWQKNIEFEKMIQTEMHKSQIELIEKNLQGKYANILDQFKQFGFELNDEKVEALKADYVVPNKNVSVKAIRKPLKENMIEVSIMFDNPLSNDKESADAINIIEYVSAKEVRLYSVDSSVTVNDNVEINYSKDKKIVTLKVNLSNKNSNIAVMMGKGNDSTIKFDKNKYSKQFPNFIIEPSGECFPVSKTNLMFETIVEIYKNDKFTDDEIALLKQKSESNRNDNDKIDEEILKTIISIIGFKQGLIKNLI